MTTWDIWAEGYRITGEVNGATLLAASIEAPTFDDAVRKHVSTLSTEPPFPGGNSEAAYYRRHEDGHWAMYSCRLFPTDVEARKSFG